MPISKPLAGVHEGFKRGHRGDVDGRVAWLGLLRFNGNKDDVPMAASSARSRASSAGFAFQPNHNMKWDET